MSATRNDLTIAPQDAAVLLLSVVVVALIFVGLLLIGGPGVVV